MNESVLDNTAWMWGQWGCLCFENSVLPQAGCLGKVQISKPRAGLFRELIIRCGGGKQTPTVAKQEEKTIKALPYLLGKWELKTTEWSLESSWFMSSVMGAEVGIGSQLWISVFWVDEGRCDHSIKQPSPDAVLIAIAVLDSLETIMDSLDAATTQFGFDLFKELDKTNDGNVFFSPVGISTAIGMILLGTRGATAAELRKVGSFLCSCQVSNQVETWFWGWKCAHLDDDVEEFQVSQRRPLPSLDSTVSFSLWRMEFLWVGGVVSGLVKSHYSYI